MTKPTVEMRKHQNLQWVVRNDKIRDINGIVNKSDVLFAQIRLAKRPLTMSGPFTFRYFFLLSEKSQAI